MPIYTRSARPDSDAAKEYERLRRHWINADVRAVYPREIHAVESTDEVCKAVDIAVKHGLKLAVRSGGHTFAHPALMEDSILIDTTNLHRTVDYDPDTQQICYGPAARVSEAAEALAKAGRFFPHGHAPSVGLGGFTLAGGQGMFMPTWGPTVGEWIMQLQVVVPDGRVLIASSTENADLFWAARGSGQAMFGIVTRVWARTIPARQLYTRMMLFDVRDQFEVICLWAMQQSRLVPKAWTESAMMCSYSDLLEPRDSDFDTVSKSAKLHFGLFASAYVNSLEEAESLLVVWNDIPHHLQPHLIDKGAVAEMSFDQFFDVQELMTPSAPGNKWQINSCLNDPEMPLEELVKAIRPAMTDLPTRTSLGCIYCCHSFPKEDEHLCTLPQEFYISTFTRWQNKSLEPGIREPMAKIYGSLYPKSVGMYVADYNPHDEHQAKVLSPCFHLDMRAS